MVFWILMAVSIGGGLAWAILLYGRDKRRVEAGTLGRKHLEFHGWIPVPLLVVSTLVVLIGTQIFTEEYVSNEETYELALITGDEYIKADYCDGTNCVTYAPKEGSYWENLTNTGQNSVRIEEGSDTATVTIQTWDIRTQPWWSPWGGPPLRTEVHGMVNYNYAGNKVDLYNFQVPTGTVATK